MNITSDSLVIAVIALIIAAIIAGGGVIALFTQRVIVDKDSNKFVEITLPLVGKFKTNYPSVGAIAVGALLAFGVLEWFGVEIEKMPFTANVTVRNPDSQVKKTADVFVSVVPQRYRRSQSGVITGDSVDIKINVDRGEEYDVIVYVPVYTRRDGTTQRVMQFGPMKTVYANGHEMGIYKTELKIE